MKREELSIEKRESFLEFMDFKNRIIDKMIHRLIKTMLNVTDSNKHINTYDDKLSDNIKALIINTIRMNEMCHACVPYYVIDKDDNDIPCFMTTECSNKFCPFKK